MKMFRLALAGGILPGFVFLFSPQPNAQAECFPPPPGMVAWWPFDDNAIDIRGGHDGTLFGTTTYGLGEVLDAVQGDGFFDWVDIPDDPDLSFCQTCPMSVEFWAYRTGSNDGHLLGKRAGCNGFPQNYQVLWAGPEQLQWGSDAGGVGTEAGFDALPLNTWTHVAVTWNATTKSAKFYVNGVLNSTQTDATIVEQSSTLVDLSFGTIRGGESDFFAGPMDDVRVYNRELTAAEVKQLYLKGQALPTPPNNLGLVGYWSFDEGIGTKVTEDEYATLERLEQHVHHFVHEHQRVVARARDIDLHDRRRARVCSSVGTAFSA
jgi:hypothetical protein